jgi:hypothetical protein
MVAAASARGTIAQNSDPCSAESAGQALSKYSLTGIILNIRPLAFLPINRHSALESLNHKDRGQQNSHVSFVLVNSPVGAPAFYSHF